MEIDFESIARHCFRSQLDLDSVPDEEKPHARVLWFQLLHLESHLGSFAYAVRLFDKYLTNPSSPDFAFVHIAARDGSITLWNYAMALRAVKASLDASPALRARMKVSQVEQALEDFWKLFPGTKDVRDAVGHTSELMDSPKAWDKNAHPTGHIQEGIDIGPKSFWLGNLVGRNYTTSTFDGGMAKYEISDATTRRLADITIQVFSAILPRERPAASKPSVTPAKEDGGR